MPRRLTDDELTEIPQVYGVSLRLTALVSEVRERRKRDDAIAAIVNGWLNSRATPSDSMVAIAKLLEAR